MGRARKGEDVLNNQTINEILKISESFHAPYKIQEIIKDKEEREILFDRFLEIEKDLSYDWFIEYFQEEHADRKNKKQDFTPSQLSDLLNKILGHTNSNADICAGTGSLTVKRWNENKDAEFYCEELSDRTIPFLLFNLAIRNVNAIVKHGNSLTNEFLKIYKLEKGAKYSDIYETKCENNLFQTIISNPPYSLEWQPTNDNRFANYGIAPKSKADYAFLLHCLSKLNENGTMAIILPHGVLFRGANEQAIRKRLIELNLIDAIIGLTGKLFMNTDIPTVIIVLKKNKSTEDVLFIDASNEFEKNKAKNILTKENIQKIVDTYQNRKEIEKFSSIVDFKKIEENDFNLNIPRYVDNYIAEVIPTLNEIMLKMQKIDKEIELNSKQLATSMLELVGTNEKTDKEIKEFADYFSKKHGTLDVVDVIEKEVEEIIEDVPKEITGKQMRLFYEM